MLYALFDRKDLPLLYDPDSDCYGLGKSSLPFPPSLGEHDTDFYIGDDFQVFRVFKISVSEITRRHAWFFLLESEFEKEESDEEGEEEDSEVTEEEGSSEYEESLIESETVLPDSEISWQ